MNIFKLAWANLKDKKLNAGLSFMLMALGVSIISLLLMLNKQLESQFKKNIKGIDMVVGAKGSPLQLILASIYQIDAPTGNIDLDEVQKLQNNPMVKTVIPISMGDNFKSFRILGTNVKYLNHFDVNYKVGKAFSAPMEVVLGAKVAENTNLKIDELFEGTHGYDDNGEKHEEKKYKVVGILERNNSVVDNLVITSLESVWAIHDHENHNATEVLDQHSGEHLEEHGDGHSEEHGEEHSGEHGEEHSEEKQVTAMLVKFRNPMGMIAIPRMINTKTNLQAAVPSIEINRLLDLLGVGFETFRIIALVIILISGLSVFVSLYNSLKERKYEMALMLSMGASRIRLFSMLLIEGLLIAIVGSVIGLIISRLGLFLMNKSLEKNYHYNLNEFKILPEEVLVIIGALFIGVFAAALPSIGIYKINISKTLADD